MYGLLLEQKRKKMKIYHVQFVDRLDGTILSDEDVISGTACTRPTPKEHEGYVFSGWSASDEVLDAISHHMQVFAEYEKIESE